MLHLLRLLMLPVLCLPTMFLSANPELPKSNYNPKIAKASDEGEKAISRFQHDKSLRIDLWAAEPTLVQPVAFGFDEKGRCYVVETFRLHNGVTDNRNHMYWLEDDLASRTVDDRVAMYKKHAKEKFTQTYEKERDRIRLLEDTKDQGKADKSTVFAENFGLAKDGLASGVLARKGNVYFTNIPDLWLLKDTKGIGHADVQQSLSTGYGIHVAFLGHDLHGLRIGPDGKLYFSVGDRGLNVKTKEGKHLFNPDSGAVLRCDLDGSNLEMIHVGLRNPQELAFDDFGNLFTVDNNSDSGDRARFVQIVEGGDSGWRVGYQYGSSMHDQSVRQGNRGPWNYEKIWHPYHETSPAYIVPPITNFSDGPSGFTYYPGVGLNEKYKGHFFLSDFRGSPGGSGVWSFTTKARGATFEMVNPHQFVWNILATDCDFGPDGAFYISDWVDGWGLNGKGRIYKVTDPEAMKNPSIREAKELLAKGFDSLKPEELTKLLEHPHREVRQEAQFALAAKGTDCIPLFARVANESKNPVARLHAIWGLGMIRRFGDDSQVKTLVGLLSDKDPEIRGQSARVLGDGLSPSANPNIVLGKVVDIVNSLLKVVEDPEPRVRFFASMALSKVGQTYFGDSSGNMQMKGNIVQAVRNMIRDNDNKDPYLRHAGIMALSAVGPEVSPVSGIKLPEPTPTERLAMVVAYRKGKHGIRDFAAYLNDPDPRIVLETARAIHDEPIDRYLPKLAALISKPNLVNEVMFRVVNANFRLGKPENAKAIAIYAAQSNAPEPIRIMALEMLGEWDKPHRRDFVTGLTQNLGARDANVAIEALKPVLPRVFSGSQRVRQRAANVAGKLGVKEVGPFLFTLLNDPKAESSARIEALRALEALKDKKLHEGIKTAIESLDPRLRNAGRSVLLKNNPEEVLNQLKEVLNKDDIIEKQGAFTLLGEMKLPEVDTVLEGWLEKLLTNQTAPELTLDILEASAKHGSKGIIQKRKQFEEARDKKDDLNMFRESVLGGNAENGRKIFLTNATAQCQRCHKLDGEGGEVGPPLNGLAGKQNRDYLLEAIVLPNKSIAKGYESVQIVTLDGKPVSGIIRSEDKKEVKLITSEGQIVTIPVEDIDSRRKTNSAMPEDLAQKLTKSEIRDLVEFLSGLKEEWKK